MAAEVTKRFQSTPYQKRLDVILGDVMKTELPYFDVCISNTPYQVCELCDKHIYYGLTERNPDFLSSYIQAFGCIPGTSYLHSHVCLRPGILQHPRNSLYH
jgi:hypothetical protein